MGIDGCCDNFIENRVFFGGMENFRFIFCFELIEYDLIVIEVCEIVVFLVWLC